MQEKVLMKGNEAIAEAAILAGCRHYLGYPITPQTEVAAYMAKKMPKIGGTFLQAESEIAAINMVYGVAAKLCGENLLADLYSHRLVLLAGADCNDLAQRGLFLVRSGKNDARCGLFLRLEALEHYIVSQWRQFHNKLPPVWCGCRAAVFTFRFSTHCI